ncbi:MAG: hypothetical protein RSG52_09110 [Terrisporobacter sp.]|uniref:hypothetical protein n=1 Tax=Terrisporobacter sp. TaxID=1965305 RepID=UPI002FCB420A
MKNANLNNPIKFIDKKAEYEDKKHNPKLNVKKLNSKQNMVIEYEKHKKNKAYKEKKDKIKNSKVYKSRKNILKVSLCVLCLFILFSLWNIFFKPALSSSNAESSFKVESQNLSKSEISTYSSIIQQSVKSTLDINYKVVVKSVHKNGALIYGEGFFTVPEEGDVYYDIILNNYKLHSLKVNGQEYAKNK